MIMLLWGGGGEFLWLVEKSLQMQHFPLRPLLRHFYRNFPSSFVTTEFPTDNQ